MTAQGAPPELAHYYPGWIWDDQSVGHMKSLLLFFDGFALLLPREHFSTTVAQEAELAQPLRQAGLLHNFEPAGWLDEDIARTVRAAASHDSRAQGTEDAEATDAITIGHLTGSSLSIGSGHFASRTDNVQRVVEEMLRAGSVLRRRPDLGPDMVDMPVRARAAVLLKVGLAAQAKVSSHRIHLVGDLTRASRTPGGKAERSGQLLHQDMLDVGVDLSRVPLDEILDYRSEHGPTYKAYARGLRDFVRDLETADPADRPRMLQDRSESIADHAAQLRRARLAWGRPLTALACAGAGVAWTLHQADGWGAFIAALGAAAGFARPPRPESPFTYLFETRRLV
ncbi:hypothetical protein [Streptomyces sp. NPDC050504]|uniref:hypothetical protein n=1 Tax=Streptomyces sp. NPDC050504 TaxID=3365618 RepID=UPI0037B206DF